MTKKILLTGGSGFIAAHCMEQLLEQGNSVVTTVRSEDKAHRIRDAYKSQFEAGRLQIAIVPDIAKQDAFDEVVKIPGIEGVLHMASPFHWKWDDPLKELVEPAVAGTTGMLRALHRSAPSVRRVVVTSSFAAIIDEKHETDPNHTFSEANWNPDTLQDIQRSKLTAYRVSKKLAERAAWAFIAEEKPAFDLVTVNPPLVLGPVVHHLVTIASINTSNSLPVEILKGSHRNELPAPYVPLWVDVRDVAKAHVRALEKPEAGGHRLLITAGLFSPRQIVEAIRTQFPSEFGERLPGPDAPGGHIPDEDKRFKWDSTKTDELLGIEWISLEKSICDLVNSLKTANIAI